jgi:hypothetical protein
MKRFFALIPVLFLAGCISITLEAADTPTSMPPSPIPATRSAQPTLIPTATAYPVAPTPTIDLTAIPPRDSAPRALYLLVKSALWVLRNDTSPAQRLTPEDSLVTAFDIWPDDGRIAYGTKSGKLYVVLPGRQPRLLLKLPADIPYPAFINGIDWSPDGIWLAYTVEYEGNGETVQASFPSSPSGLWMVSLEGSRPTWLMSNHYPAPEQDQNDINTYRQLSDPQWSPDGKSLLVRGIYSEWTNLHWLYPLEYAEDGRYLHSFPKDSTGNVLWTHAAWMPDSKGLLLSGQANTTFGSLAYSSRDGSQSEIWIEGKLANLFITDAILVPDDSFLPGTVQGMAAGPGRMIFLGSCPVCLDNPEARLFVMKTKIVDPYLNGTMIGPERLCTGNDVHGKPNRTGHIEWMPDLSLGVLQCGPNEIYLINLHRESPILTDLLPDLPALLPNEMPVFRWGELYQ